MNMNNHRESRNIKKNSRRKKQEISNVREWLE